MIYRKQLFRHDPANEIFGDCWRTCIACILNLEPWKVPHFYQNWLMGKFPEAPIENCRSWLKSQGYGLASMQFDGRDPIEELLANMAMLSPGVHYILDGSSARGIAHSIVCKDDELIWDPHPSNTMLAGPLKFGRNGIWQINLIIPAITVGDN